MSKYATRDTVKYLKENFKWKKLPNFQLVKPLTVEQQIERFTTAGRDMQKLAGLGVFDFDVNTPIDDMIDDVTQNDDFDLIDAAVANRDARLRLQAQLASAEQEKPVQLQEPVERVETKQDKVSTAEDTKES